MPFYVENIGSETNTFGIGFKEFAGEIGLVQLTFEISEDGQTWIEHTIDTSSQESGFFTTEFTEKIYVRANTTSYCVWDEERINGYSIMIACMNPFNVGGNTMSLLYGSDFTGDETSFPEGSVNTFSYLFEGLPIVSAENLMLPATTLTPYCYSYMFWECTSLTEAPQLPATTLAKYCYNNMFGGCTLLESVIVYVTGEWNTGNTSYWLKGVNEYNGTLYNLGGATQIPTNDPSGCPSGWHIETTPPTPKGTGWTPSDPIDITGTELEDLLAGGAKGPQHQQQEEESDGANQGYFYNVTEASIKYSVGLYVAVTPNTVQSFDINNSMTEEEFKALVDKGSLISKTIYYITDSEKVCVASSSSTYKAIEREEPSPKSGYVIEDVTEEYESKYQWNVTFEVTVDNNEVLSFDTKDSLSEYSNMQYTLTDSNKKLYAENSFNSVPVSVYTMSDLKDGEYILLLQGGKTVYRYFSITKGTPSEDYTITDDTPSDKRWDNSFDVYVDPNFKEGNMTLLIAANENTTSFEGEVDYSLNSESKQKEIASSGFSYEELKKGPKPVYLMDTLEDGTYYLILNDPTGTGYYRYYTIIKSV